MRNALVILFVSMSVMLTAGCGEQRVEPPPGYVDPGTDPQAVGGQLGPTPSEMAPTK